MSDDEFERRLREAGHRLPGPEATETLRARTRFLDAAPAGGRGRRRPLVLALAAVLVVAGAFGVGYAVAAGATSTVTTTKVVHVKARLDAGPGFLPADGWSTSVELDPRTGAIRSATATGGTGTSIVARFAPASMRPGLRRRTLPLQLPSGGRTRALHARIGAYAVDVSVGLPALHPAAVVAAAREELGRLAVPSCPAAQPLVTEAGPAGKAQRSLARSEAEAFVLHWLQGHYGGAPADAAGATASARLGRAMPRHGEAAADCGAAVAARAVEVDVTLPKLAKVGASLSELTYFVAKTDQGWTVWERVR